MIGLFSPILSSVSGYINIEKILSESILLIIYIIILLKRNLSMKFSYSQIIIYVMLLSIYFINIIKGNEFGLYGVYSIFLMTYVYTDIFIRYGRSSIKEIKRGIAVILFINIAFIFFENTLNFLGLEKFFVDILNGKYRLDLNVPFSFLKSIEFSSANSLMLKAQGASVILGLAVIWYLDPFSVNLNKSYRYLLCISLLLYSIQFTSTSMIMLISIIIFSIYFLPYNKFRMGLSKSSLLLLLLLFSPAIFKIIFYKFDGYVVNTSYVNALDATLNLIHSLNISELLFGIGGSSDASIVNNRVFVESADIGILMILVMGGSIIFILLLTVLAAYFYNGISLANKNRFENKKHIALLLASILVLVFGFIISTIHYTTPLMPGGRQFFAFLIAGSIYCFNLLRIPQS